MLCMIFSIFILFAAGLISQAEHENVDDVLKKEYDCMWDIICVLDRVEDIRDVAVVMDKKTLSHIIDKFREFDPDLIYDVEDIYENNPSFKEAFAHHTCKMTDENRENIMDFGSHYMMQYASRVCLDGDNEECIGIEKLKLKYGEIMAKNSDECMEEEAKRQEVPIKL